jgi:diaminopimelate epimerase
MNIYKYQSIGNDFILLDWLDLPAVKIAQSITNPEWPAHVRSLCNRQTGIGADGVLIISKQHEHTEVLIFNADGSNGQKCLNGLRCAALHLVNKRNYPQTLQLAMHKQHITCIVDPTSGLITINAGTAIYQQPQQITVANNTLNGHIIDTGNPHFVIMQKVQLNWLKQYGSEIEHHKLFPNRTNVEFVWHNQEASKLQHTKVYGALVYERGCGITQACGTGAAAIMQTLLHQQIVTHNEPVSIKMPGGIINSHINNNNEIIQSATAKLCS